MIYSVFNRSTKRYDYYQAGPASSATHAVAPPAPLVRSPLGATPSQAAWTLPAGATKLGSGDLARGRIAALGNDDDGGFGIVPVLAIAGAVLYFFTR